ncbi:MAG: hypothetical protein AAF805_05885 [Planctomycetota bacterium]
MIALSTPAAALTAPPVGGGASSRVSAGGFHVVVAGGRPISRDALERLEALDDTVFDALDGDAAALDRAEAAWRDADRRIDPRLLEESRQQYVARARSRWRRSQRRGGSDRLARGFAALEVLRLLGEEPSGMIASAAG